MISAFDGGGGCLAYFVDYAFLTWLAHFVVYWYFDAGHLLVGAEVRRYALLEIARNYYSNEIDFTWNVAFVYCEFDRCRDYFPVH